MQKKKRSYSRIGFVIAATGLAGTTVSSLKELRENNLEMLRLRDAVISADESGIEITERLAELQLHVTTHMNATPPKLGSEPAIQLKNSYDRAKLVEQTRVSAERTAIANDATIYCEENFRTALLSVRADCVARYVADRPVEERTIVADLYRYDFVSPRWSPDAAGWSIVIAIFFALTLAVLLASKIIAILRLK